MSGTETDKPKRKRSRWPLLVALGGLLLALLAPFIALRFHTPLQIVHRDHLYSANYYPVPRIFADRPGAPWVAVHSSDGYVHTVQLRVGTDLYTFGTMDLKAFR